MELKNIPSNGIDALYYEDVETSSVIALTYPFLETRGGEINDMSNKLRSYKYCRRFTAK